MIAIVIQENVKIVVNKSLILSIRYINVDSKVTHYLLIVPFSISTFNFEQLLIESSYKTRKKLSIINSKIDLVLY